MIKAIIFDLGGVLFTNGTKKFIEDLSSKYNLDPHEVLNTFDSGLGTEYREAKISRNEFWEKALAKFGIKENAADLELEWINDYQLIEGTRDIIFELAENYNVYFLSDNVRERIEGINQRYDFLKWFDGGIFSHEAGVRKPSPEIYQMALDKVGVPAEEVIFIDDKASSLPPAQELGITTLLFTNPENLRKRLVEMEIL